MEAYRDELLTSREVGEILGLDRFDVEVLCKKYRISTYHSKTQPRWGNPQTAGF